MAALGRRHRSSTAASSSPASIALTAEIHPLLSSLSKPTTTSDVHLAWLPKVEALQRIRQVLVDSDDPLRAKDVFRQLQGFQTSLNTLRVVAALHVKATYSDPRAILFEVVRSSLAVISQALLEHKGNKRYFAKRVFDGGWKALQNILESSYATNEADSLEDGHLEDLFGRLLAFALGDDSVTSLFRGISRMIPTESQIDTDVSSVQNDRNETGSIQPSVSSQHLNGEKIEGQMRQRVMAALQNNERLQNPQVLLVILNLWINIDRSKKHAQRMHWLEAVPILADELALMSKHNLVAIHTSGILSLLLPLFLSQSQDNGKTAVPRRLIENILSMGIADLSDGRVLFRAAMESPQAADILLKALKSSSAPSCIQFDLSLHGYSSVELRTIDHSFPPTSPSAGYTFCAWVHVDQFDENNHTTLFGAFDGSQTCFVLIYLEKKSHNLIFQTSVTSTRPSVRFKSIAFEAGQWYHIALVHRRPRTTSSSKATLLVNGEFKEQIKCQYPSPPPATQQVQESVQSVISGPPKQSVVQVFLGTPQDLAFRIGQGLMKTRWSLASAHLFGEVVGEDLIAVYYRLGPRYEGNYQDSLGSFQTYEASAHLNMRNEMAHPGKEEKSDIVAAIRSKAGFLMPEHRVFFNISPGTILDDNEQYGINETQLTKSLSRNSIHNLRHWIHSIGNVIAINGAVPSINEALSQSRGTAILTGDPTVVLLQSLDDVSWRVGGCASVGLKMVESAGTADGVLHAVEILLTSVSTSWRNSEVMEKENGFAVLGGLLKGKMGLGTVIGANAGTSPVAIEGGDKEHERLGFGLLSLILGFVGYCHENPKESIIVNQLAYRVLLVDFDIWRKTNLLTQKLYYEQFETFGQTSIHRIFNSKRLMRMRIVKKLVEVLKGESVTTEAFPYFVSAFRSLVEHNTSAEVLRSLALFITYALHRPVNSMAPSLRTKKSTIELGERRRANSVQPKASKVEQDLREKSAPAGKLSYAELGVEILNLYTDILCKDKSNHVVQKFARTVTNKWLLYLLAEDDARVVLQSAKILARVLVIHGKSYVDKFATKTGGFIVMQHRLKKWWNIPTIWPICFAILFNVDTGDVNFNGTFDLYNLLNTFAKNGNAQVVYPEVLPVIMTLLKTGLQAIVHDPLPFSSPNNANGNGHSSEQKAARPRHLRKRSMSLGSELASLGTQETVQIQLAENAALLQTLARFLGDIHGRSRAFQDFSINSKYVQELFFVLFPVIVTSDTVSAETELESRDSTLNFNGSDVTIMSLSHNSDKPAPMVRTSSTEPNTSNPSRARAVRRGSSFVLVTAHARPQSSSTQLAHTKDRRPNPIAKSASNSVVEALLENVIAVFIDQILERKDFAGFDFLLKVPPGFQEHQAYFNTYVMRNTLSHIGNTLQLSQSRLHEPRVLTNIARLAAYLDESLSEGWFLNGAEPSLDFIGTILEYLQRSDVSRIKSVRLCSQTIQSIRRVFMKVVLLRFSETDNPSLSQNDTVIFLERILYWQTVILSPENTEKGFLKLMCYLMYNKLVDPRERVRSVAADLWRMTLVQRPEDTTEVLDSGISTNQKTLSSGFRKLMEIDNETFLYWIDENRRQLDALFFGAMAAVWEEYVSKENQATEDIMTNRLSKRKEKLKQWVSEDMVDDDTFRKHEVSSGHWVSNISSSEHVKHLRSLQDQQDDYNFIASNFNRLDRQLRRPSGLLDEHSTIRWQLDLTEGRNRMRLRLLPDQRTRDQDYQPKGKHQEPLKMNSLRVNTRVESLTSPGTEVGTPVTIRSNSRVDETSDSKQVILDGPFTEEPEEQEEFEIVDGPHTSEEGFEDRNRKVIRSLQRGDQILHVYNISRIIGLEFCEGLLILGKDSLYLLDNFFQRPDGEIVNVWQATKDERDPYLQMISGRETRLSKPRSTSTTSAESRHWKWSEVLSFSKRRFLFRDVAIEIFFTDGRSYLLTAMSPVSRDEVHTKLVVKAPQATGNMALVNPEDAWRVESLRAHDEVPQTFGSKLANVFGPGYANPATKKWARGEISNFHYLMLVNTMAGRTFNDLTQYPVFPWILADYTSEELDLTNPRSFRDLTKPMGCQTAARQAEFRDRYQSFAEMGDPNTPSFHYGTHYSSAMIVTSYLIRLQPFVQSYLLLQGGSFDHPDRLFFSIERAWRSASQDNMTDVRELIPEFFYLPEFLTNSNDFNFGARQSNGERIDTVVLPPWAKGDPRIFIAKHREALESPYVSKQLHQWIDLVFGFKQKGEAAFEATNMFHHLSYHGAKNLDNIEDPVERLATIGIIHNFGQTPHQIFQRAHPPREETNHKFKRLDTAAESLTRLPFPLLETHERVSSLIFSNKLDRLLCSAAFRINIPPAYDRYMEWGFIDGGVRFYLAESRKLVGLFEHLHTGQVSSAIFADSRTLVTAGTDSTISVWAVMSESKIVDLQHRATLFGHVKPVTVLALSRSFSSLISASEDGAVFLWDLNRLELIRKLADEGPVECAKINDISGTILLCRGSVATMYTLNGDALLTQNLCESPDNAIVSCAFYEGVGNEWLEREVLLTGHKRGVVWAKTTKDGEFGLELIKQLNHRMRDSEVESNTDAAITCILAMPQTVYTGDENGRVHEWNCVQRQGGKV